jgi:hypothetical protein
MEQSTNVDAALRHYEALKSAQKRYYQKVRESRLAKYKEEHPNPRPRGRPRKGVAEGGSSEGV